MITTANNGGSWIIRISIGAECGLRSVCVSASRIPRKAVPEEAAAQNFSYIYVNNGMEDMGQICVEAVRININYGEPRPFEMWQTERKKIKKPNTQ